MFESFDNLNFPVTIELCNALTSHDLEGLLDAYDNICVSVDLDKKIGEVCTDAQLLENCNIDKISPNFKRTPDMHKNLNNLVRVIQIQKGCEPLGATIRNEGDTVVIGRVVKGGVADMSALLHEGDEILEVNGIQMKGKSVNDVCESISTMQGTLTFLILPAFSQPQQSVRETPILHVRANFDYDPEEDLYIPCRELGIRFMKGDILHVISRDDPNWWQAYTESDGNNSLAGLIPSQSFQHQRESIKIAIAEDLNRFHKSSPHKLNTTLLCSRRGKKKKKA